MKLYILLVLFERLVSGEKDAKIIGGRFALKNEFPFAVSLVNGRAHTCGGSLLTFSSVLTAGHCVVYEVWPFGQFIYTGFTVVGGSLNFDVNVNDPEMQIRHVVTVHLHHGYKLKKNGAAYNDIALAFLLAPFVKSPSVNVLTFQMKSQPEFKEYWNSIVRSGKTCIGIGWGLTQKSGNVSPVLKVVTMKPRSNSYCRPFGIIYGDKDMTEKGEVCLSTIVNGTGICSGDSGGPLICDGIVFAVLNSVYKECANIRYPAKYLLLWPYMTLYHLGDPLLASFSIVFKQSLFTLVLASIL